MFVLIHNCIPQLKTNKKKYEDFVPEVELYLECFKCVTWHVQKLCSLGEIGSKISLKLENVDTTFYKTISNIKANEIHTCNFFTMDDFD